MARVKKTVLNTSVVRRRETRFDPRKGGKVVRSLPRFPPFGILRIFALAIFAILVTGVALYRQITLPKPKLFLPPTASTTQAASDDGLIYIDIPPPTPSAAAMP